MKTFTGSVTQDVVDSFYLQEQLLAFPEIKKQFITQQCEQRDFTLLMLTFGYGRAITNKDLTKEKMLIADKGIQWTIQTRLRELLTFADTPAAGQGANNGVINFKLKENWAVSGMVLLVEDGNGSWQNLIIISDGVLNAGVYDYTGKLQTNNNAETFDVSFIVEDTKVGWGWAISPLCGDDYTKTPFKSLDWYKNYTTLIKLGKEICKDGIQQALWIEGEDGTLCYAPMEENQHFFHFIASMEFAGWYSTSTYNEDGEVIVTNADGELLPAGDGVLMQINSGNVVNWVVSDYDSQPEYAAFRQMIKETIIVWSIDNGYDADPNVELHVYAGLAAFALWQEALIDFIIQGHGCCLMDYETGDMVSVGVNVSSYKFCGFVLHLHRCSSFNNKGFHGANYANTTIPLESYRFIIMPDTNCNGEPLIQCYFRGGCGVSSAYNHTVIPGTVDPTNLGAATVKGASALRGYKVVDESEFVFIVSDPSKIINFQPTPNGS